MACFKFGPTQPGWTAMVGDWDADGLDTIGLYKDGVWRLRNSNSEGGVDVGFTFLPAAKDWTPLAGYRGGMAGLNSLGLVDEPSAFLTLEVLPPTATSETTTPTESVTSSPEVTEPVILPTETPTAMEMPPNTEIPTEVVTPTLLPPTDAPTEVVAPEAAQTP